MRNKSTTDLLGDVVWARTERIAARMDDAEFAAAMRSQSLPAERWLKYIASIYPIVVGFNGALIRSLAKVDHVRQSWLIKGLAVQLQEEQEHNNMFRRMLEDFGIDHEAVYSAFERDLSAMSRETLDRATAGVVAAIRADEDDFAPGQFHLNNFAESVYALHHHMHTLATDRRYSFWHHFASQCAIEAVIYRTVSALIYPTVSGDSALNVGEQSVLWFKEHAAHDAGDGSRSAEEKHLQIARLTLNKSREANDDAAAILDSVETSLRLFAATALCHGADNNGWIEKSPLLSGQVVDKSVSLSIH